MTATGHQSRQLHKSLQKSMTGLLIYHCQVIINKALGVLANYENCHKAAINKVGCNKNQRTNGTKNLLTSLAIIGEYHD